MDGTLVFEISVITNRRRGWLAVKNRSIQWLDCEPGRIFFINGEFLESWMRGRDRTIEVNAPGVTVIKKRNGLLATIHRQGGNKRRTP